ncbi:hypothetical protein ACFFX1_54975 [Dactylosporangium sucinum]|uniref:Uncharacterized protein n=1 Tax=Dactylosporangium sucinum TaxID=1424081 RepID=A0A917X1R9_9ACTN|nr:hypothetical protein [Dactylosporangium sucinum]GGM53296.1 hypothetical protein GCM10007977_063650 [Dactylosporangium sucinum]
MTIPDLTVGDWETAHIDVAPYDGSTAATLTLHSPADTDPAGTLIPLDGGVELINEDGQAVKRFTQVSAVQYPVSGWWVRSWDITGVGASQPDERFFVSPNPVAGGPTWTPTRERVADFVPHRTIPEAFESQGEPLLTFTANTTPRGATVDRLITGAVGWVLTTTGDLHTSLGDAAQEAAALRAAGFVELAGMPTVDRDLADALFTQADAALKALAARNESLTGVDPDDPDAVFEIVPLYSFPPASSWGDSLL